MDVTAGEARRGRGFLTLLATGALLASAIGAAGATDRLTTRTVITPFERAGVLGGSNSTDDYSLRAAGGSVIFATAASNFFQTAGRRPGEDDHGGGEGTVGAAAEEDSGKELLCMQLLDEAGGILCFAERPSQPGWQRDPRLACPLSGDPAVTLNYVLRVSYADTDCSDANYPASPVKKDGTAVSTPYKIEGSLQGAPGDGPLF